ncbi:MAG: hypothetical protein LBH40_01440 [Alphaproteobacteria bacterium]|jgi:hypothetical protein|nr:hypothetical protein [Alphaproteobacteria bacterium]
MFMTQNMLIASISCVIALAIGSYISRGNPDFFDIYVESIAFTTINRLHPNSYLSLFKIKTNGVRKWEA